MGRLPESHTYFKTMETIKLKKPKKKIKINHLIKNDQIELRTESGSILKCKIDFVDNNVYNHYTGRVLNARKTKSGILPGQLINFSIEDVHEVLRVGSEYQFRTIKELREMLEAGCSIDEILKNTERNLQSDIYVFNDKMQQRKTTINNGSVLFFRCVWDQFAYNSAYEAKSKLFL